MRLQSPSITWEIIMETAFLHSQTAASVMSRWIVAACNNKSLTWISCLAYMVWNLLNCNHQSYACLTWWIERRPTYYLLKHPTIFTQIAKTALLLDPGSHDLMPRWFSFGRVVIFSIKTFLFFCSELVFAVYLA